MADHYAVKKVSNLGLIFFRVSKGRFYLRGYRRHRKASLAASDVITLKFIKHLKVQKIKM